MSLFDTFDNLAVNMLTKYGSTLVLKRIESTAYNPATSSVTESIEITSSGYGYLANYNFNEIDGTMIMSTDSKLIMHRLDFEPEVDDLVDIDNDIYRIMMVKKLRAEGKTPAYICQVRK